MKKVLGVLVLGLIVSFSAVALHAGYILEDGMWDNEDIINKKDPTSFQRLTLEEEGKKINFWDRRNETSSGFPKSDFNAYIFKASYEKSHNIFIRVNSEFKSIKKAEKEALKYAKAYGQLPNFIKSHIRTLTIHKGNYDMGGGNNDILIHTGYSPIKGQEQGFLEELFLHEGSHNLDVNWGGPIDTNIGSKWRVAQKADKNFISKYAKDNPYREDLPETVLWWIAVKYKADKISKSNYNKILENIPNRIKYLDNQNYDMFPLYNKALILSPDTLAIFCKAQDDCWDTMLEDYQQYLKEPPYKAWATTRNIMSKEFNGNVWGWRTGGDSVMEVKVGANETCEKFKDSDDECVVVFLGNEFVDERIKKMLSGGCTLGIDC
jgi:hypothetical protein